MELNKERRDAILKLRQEGKTYGQICKELNCTKSIVAFYCNPKRYDSIEKDKKKEQAKREYEELVCSLVKQCDNINQVCKLLGKKATNNNYIFVEKIINKYDIDTNHFCVNFEKKNNHKPYTKEEIFVENSTIKTSRLLPAILKYNLKDYKCECCGNSEWMGEKIPLQTHHINGNNTDNRIENLMLVCPNCHAMTDTYCGKRKKRKLPEKHKMKICPICGKEYSGKNKFCSKDCYEKYKKQNFTKYQKNITKEKLIIAFMQLKTFTSVGKYFNVSDKTISKWCESFELPQTAKKMKEYISSV